jgi:release factor glutamine methyltransferase
VSENGSAELSRLAELVTGMESDRFLLLRMTRELPPLTEEDYARLCHLVSLREQGEPLQYLLGTADFYGRSFSVAKGVLIPRFDTEILVDTALPLVSPGDTLLDLCAGTGCIGLTLGAEKNLSVTAVEKYDDAFALLQENAQRIYPSARLIQEDIFTYEPKETYDIIVSNPPYIPTKDLQTLSPEVQKEPVTALDGGDDGLHFYRAIIEGYSSCLKDGGYLLFECGIGQGFAIEQMLLSNGFSQPLRASDYGGVVRVVGAKK